MWWVRFEGAACVIDHAANLILLRKDGRKHQATQPAPNDGDTRVLREGLTREVQLQLVDPVILPQRTASRSAMALPPLALPTR